MQSAPAHKFRSARIIGKGASPDAGLILRSGSASSSPLQLWRSMAQTVSRADCDSYQLAPMSAFDLSDFQQGRCERSLNNAIMGKDLDQPAAADGGTGMAANGRLAATLLLAAVMNGPLAASRLVLPVIALGLGASALVVGLLSSLFTVAPMLLNVAYGRWVDRVGSLVPFVVANGLILCGGLVFAAAPMAGTLFASAALIGAGTVFAHVAATRGVSEADDPARRTRNLGYMMMLYSVFQLAMPVAIGALHETHGARVAVAAVGSIGAVVLVAMAPGFHAFRMARRRAPAAKPRVADLLRHRELVRRIAVSGVFSAAQTLFPFIISLLAFGAGLTTAQAGVVVGALALGAITSRFCVGWIVARAEPRSLLAGALIASAIVYVVLPWFTGVAPLALLAILIGLPIGIGVPISFGLIYEASPEGRANESIGLTMTATNILQTALPVIAGVVATLAGVVGVTGMTATIMIAAAWLAWRVEPASAQRETGRL
ncbi:MAG: MFS transporter [Methylobacteriaceae bacterium]|nr:MFS transporter [Methylobacteriaceae bacterium]